MSHVGAVRPCSVLDVSLAILNLARNEVLGNANGIAPVFTAQHNVRHLARASILLNHASRILVIAQADKLRMSQPISFGPFQEFDLSDGFGRQPNRLFHFLSVEFFPKS